MRFIQYWRYKNILSYFLKDTSKYCLKNIRINYDECESAQPVDATCIFYFVPPLHLYCEIRVIVFYSHPGPSLWLSNSRNSKVRVLVYIFVFIWTCIYCIVFYAKGTNNVCIDTTPPRVSRVNDSPLTLSPEQCISPSLVSRATSPMSSEQYLSPFHVTRAMSLPSPYCQSNVSPLPFLHINVSPSSCLQCNVSRLALQPDWDQSTYHLRVSIARAVPSYAQCICLPYRQSNVSPLSMSPEQCLSVPCNHSNVFPSPCLQNNPLSPPHFTRKMSLPPSRVARAFSPLPILPE